MSIEITYYREQFYAGGEFKVKRSKTPIVNSA